MSPLDAPVLETAWAALDFESAGAAPGRSDEPVQVGIAVMRRGELGELFRSFIRSPVRVTRAARAVHGIGDDDLADAPPMASLWPEFKARLSGSVVVAHGAGTEKRFLRAFPLHGFGPWLDTLALARAALPDLGGHSLAEVVKALGVEDEVRARCPGLDWHDALFDAVACLAVLRRVVELIGSADLTVGQLVAMDASSCLRRRALRQTARSAGWPD